ncbi:MAG: 1-deoxy-D-xylulose-5-phosphate synthase [Thermodesulfovibrionales bacterium]
MILERIASPADLRKLDAAELRALADELRDVVIRTVSENGGHLASNLGIVELTIALHTVFDTPRDRIVWDVGHQSYCHKLLTGRRGRFATIRREGGLSGFPKREESEYDAFGTGHSSTSISAALGILEGRDRNHDDFKVIAVIGDGAMTGGLAFEGLNNAGHLNKDLIVILNDNEMSISPNVGALSSYMNRVLSAEFYRKFKKETKTFLQGIPRFGVPVAKIAQKAEETLKGILLPGMLFQELGFEYIGPIDGHNIEALIETLRNIRTSTSPTLVHVITQKGRGYEFSEKDPCVFHGVGPFEVETGSQLCAPGSVSYSAAFGAAVTDLAAGDPRIVAITAAMKEGTGLEEFGRKFPSRLYDVGIAEQHAVTFAAGLATQGYRPVVAVYSTFLQRAYDQIVHDVCLQKLPVLFAIDRAGFVGEDGPTHHGLFDVSFLRHIPNLTLMAPKDRIELRRMLEFAITLPGPSAIRYPRGTAPDAVVPPAEIILGAAEMLRDGSDLALIAAGSTVLSALKAAERLRGDGHSVCVVNARFLNPVDRAMIRELAERFPLLMTIEENQLKGGFGSAVLECLSDLDLGSVRVRRLGVPDRFIEQASPDALRRHYGIDADGIYQNALSFLRSRTHRG